jgi:hypothetical protein
VTDTTFAMALRTGNWDSSVLLPFHKPVLVSLAPIDRPDALLTLESSAGAIPSVVTAGDIDSLTVADAGGRVVVRLDARSGRVERPSSASLATASAWELRLEGKRGLLVLYSRDEQRPGSDVLDRLVDRLGAAATR